jgi:16S rRNA (cytosine967-C5)-methyltransferase
VNRDMNPRNLALQVLNKLDHHSGHPGYSLERVTQGDMRFSDRDRAFAVNLVQGVLRWRLRLDWILQQTIRFPFKNIRPDVLNVLRLALYQIFFLDRVPDSAAVNEAVKQVKRMAASHVVRSVNGILRQVCREKENVSFPGRSPELIRHLSIHYSYPEWLVLKWVREMGEADAERLLIAGNSIPSLVVRTNTLRIDRARLIASLKEEGVSATPTNLSPEGLLLADMKGPLDRLSSFQSGLFQVQGEAAQVCSHFLSPRPGETILDVCSGLGGKSTHMAQLMEDRGLIVGIDRNRQKLLKLTENCGRLGIHLVKSLAGDVERDLQALLKSSFDRIMVDGPCSALGVISRHPDVKWNREERDLIRLGKLQERILNRTLPLLRAGGNMLYVTCTLSREENEGVVEGFLQKNKGVKLVNLRKSGPGCARDLVDETGFMKSFPHVHGIDGFFGALFEKRA